MKKIVCLLLMFSVLLSFGVSSFYAEGQPSSDKKVWGEGLSGDADNDGSIDIIDATIIQRHCSGIRVPCLYATLADADGNGDIDVIDATFIQRYCAGIQTVDSIGTVVSTNWSSSNRTCPEFDSLCEDVCGDRKAVINGVELDDSDIGFLMNAFLFDESFEPFEEKFHLTHVTYKSNFDMNSQYYNTDYSSQFYVTIYDDDADGCYDSGDDTPFLDTCIRMSVSNSCLEECLANGIIPSSIFVCVDSAKVMDMQYAKNVGVSDYMDFFSIKNACPFYVYDFPGVSYVDWSSYKSIWESIGLSMDDLTRFDTSDVDIQGEIATWLDTDTDYLYNQLEVSKGYLHSSQLYGYSFQDVCLTFRSAVGKGTDRNEIYMYTYVNSLKKSALLQYSLEYYCIF